MKQVILDLWRVKITAKVQILMKNKTKSLNYTIAILKCTIAEALFIQKFKPQINVQSEFFHGTLSLL